MSTNSASRTASRDELAALLRQTGMNHHQAFIETNGADPEWARLRLGRRSYSAY